MSAPWDPEATVERAGRLMADARRRWLTKDELVFLLLHYRLLGCPIHRTLQMRPQSTAPKPTSAPFNCGTLLLYDTTYVSDYKKDGWQWQKRKDNSGRVREDRAKLVVKREVIVLGTYVHSDEIASFHRRSYALRDSEQHIVLVHYFDEANKQSDAHNSLVVPSMPVVAAPRRRSVTGKGIKRSLPASMVNISTPCPPPTVPMPESVQREESVDSIMEDCFQMDFVDHAMQFKQELSPGIPNSFDWTKNDMFDDVLFPDTPSNIDIKSASNSDLQSVHNTPLVLSQISDFSPDWDFVVGGAKILICLASPLPQIYSNDPLRLFIQFGNGSQVSAEKVSETVLRCTAPNASTAGMVEIFVCYCESGMPQQIIQLSNKRMFTYRSPQQSSPPPAVLAAPDPALFNPLAVTVTATPSNVGKRHRSPAKVRSSFRNARDELLSASRKQDGTALGFDRTNLSSFVDTDLDERQCKIRVVERLSEFHNAIWTTTSADMAGPAISNLPSSANSHQLSPAFAAQQQFSAQLPVTEHQSTEPNGSTDTLATNGNVAASLDDSAIETLSDRDLEQLSEKLLERVVQQLVAVAHTSEELLEELNSLDETGLSLLHYVSFYNYAKLVPLLLSHGAHVNQQSTQGQTALHLAAGCGHEDVVEALVQADADAFAVDSDGFTPFERAEKSGHTAVALRLRRLMWPFDGIDDEIVMDSRGSFLGSGANSPLFDGEDGVSTMCDSPQERPRTGSIYADENHEHNRKLLLGAFSTMSLHDKCALSLSISREGGANGSRRNGSISYSDETSGLSYGSSGPGSASPVRGYDGDGAFESDSSMRDSEVKSVIADDEASLNKLEAAMELMGPEERQSLEDEVIVLQHNIRAWLLRRNCKNMRETTKKLNEATKTIEDHQKQQQQELSSQELSERERAAVTVQAATRSMLARKSFLQTKNVTIKVQAATRGVLCRKNFARMKTHALASLVIQRNVREWWHKQPSSGKTSAKSAFQAQDHLSDDELAFATLMK